MSQGRKCVHAARFYSKNKTNSSKTPRCPYKNVTKCPEYKQWQKWRDYEIKK